MGIPGAMPPGAPNPGGVGPPPGHAPTAPQPHVNPAFFTSSASQVPLSSAGPLVSSTQAGYVSNNIIKYSTLCYQGLKPINGIFLF